MEEKQVRINERGIVRVGIKWKSKLMNESNMKA